METHLARVAPEKAVFPPALPTCAYVGLPREKRMAMTYTEQLKHPRWQRRRLEVLSAHDFACTACRSTETTLHVHHKRYVKGRQVWEYPDSELTVLCEMCHEQYHDWKGLLDEIVAMLPPDDIGRFTAFVGGVLDVFLDKAFLDRVGTASSLHYYSGQAAAVSSLIYRAACSEARGNDFWEDLRALRDKYDPDAREESTA